jgi:hypothetical protein
LLRASFSAATRSRAELAIQNAVDISIIGLRKKLFSPPERSCQGEGASRQDFDGLRRTAMVSPGAAAEDLQLRIFQSRQSSVDHPMIGLARNEP